MSASRSAPRSSGIPVEGICIYPIADYPGWTNGRHCEVGLLGPLDERGERVICLPLAEELRRQQALLEDPLALQPSVAGASAGPGEQRMAATAASTAGDS